MSRRSAYALGSGALLVAALAGIFFLLRAPSVAYLTVPVERGAIEATVTAMGTLNPVRTVEVSARMSTWSSTTRICLDRFMHPPPRLRPVIPDSERRQRWKRYVPPPGFAQIRR